MKIRQFPEFNYKAIFSDGDTIRIAFNPSEPIKEIPFPEFYDISFGNKCVSGGNGRKDNNSSCYYCYASAHAGGKHYSDIPGKIHNYFGRLNENQKPFSVAIGGSQEPLEHPQFWDGVKAFKDLGIVPNYTTNGVFVNDKCAELTKQHCGGVAVTLHKHLEVFWRKAIEKFVKAEVRTNIHFIVSDEASIELLEGLYKEYSQFIDYFVLLPYMNVGFAEQNPVKLNFERLEGWVDTVFGDGKLAFGANFYPWIKNNKKWGLSLYEPEILSKYLVMDDNMSLYSDSFKMRPVRDFVKEVC